VGSFDDPAAGAIAWFALAFDFLLASRLDVRYVVSAFQKFASVLGVVTFVETDVLLLARRGLGTVDRYVVES
jgi:hypothetical protein